ncbi:MAG: metallophosphoesterase [Ruminococcus sp.]|nr:metallophosphoesterase [Ruminococcus sp.]
MKILVFSDTHGDKLSMQSAIKSHRDADVVIHCGDGEDDVNSAKLLYPDKAYYNVRGNCDWGSSLDVALELVFEGKKLFVTHGHIYNVKWGKQNLIMAAEERGADIVLYGHTHIPENEYYDGLYVFNPGSCHGYGATYGVIEITEKGILTNIVPCK